MNTVWMQSHNLLAKPLGLACVIGATVCLAGCSTHTAPVASHTSAPGSDALNSSQTIWAGVYSAAQAEAGETLYGRYCATCHGRSLEGNDDYCGPALVGDGFWRKWNGTSVGKFYERIQQTMPEKQPHSLPDQEYAAIVSFVFRANEIPLGPRDLPSDPSVLNRILMTNHSPKR
jgi:mono/diheme cytochrome c family protein